MDTERESFSFTPQKVVLVYGMSKLCYESGQVTKGKNSCIFRKKRDQININVGYLFIGNEL